MRGSRIQCWLRSFVAGTLIIAGLSGFAEGTHASKISDARQQLNHVKMEKNYNQQRIRDLTAKEVSIETQLSDMTQQITTTSDNITQLEQQMRLETVRIQRTKTAVTVAQKQMKHLDSLLKQRLQVMYENGSVSYIDVIFSSTSFSDFLNRMSALTLIARQDDTLLQSVRAERTHLDAVYASLLTQKQSEVTTYNNLQVDKQTESKEIAAKKIVLADVQQQKAAAIADLQQELGAEQNLAAQINQLLQSNPSLGDTSKLNLGTGPWIWPVPGYYDITSPYGWRYIFGSEEFHNGIDIGAPAGTPIDAVADGVVLYAGTAEGFGHWIVLKHANGLLTVYGHMYASGLLVKPGDVVKQGQVIAYVGADGQSTGPHLHFTVATGFDDTGHPVSLNPFNYVHS